MSVSTGFNAAFNSFKTTIIDIDIDALGSKIGGLIADVGQLNVVSVGDLKVYGASDGTSPKDVKEALQWGTKFFDAVYYFALSEAQRPAVKVGIDGSKDIGESMLVVKKRLLWTAIFLMLRGSYPESQGMRIGSDIPAFLVNICQMKESPADTANGLASFSLGAVNPRWIKKIDWSKFASPIRQRLALGLAGYRQLGPFKLYDCRSDADQSVIDAFNWVRSITSRKLDYSILSATRDPALISRLGSWNKALGNLMLVCFTDAQLQEMVTNKIIFSIPVRDPRSDTWKSWSAGGELSLEDPIGL
jgi:hypothetical protein